LRNLNAGSVIIAALLIESGAVMCERDLAEAHEASLLAGDRALETGDWEQARDQFQSAREAVESPESLEGLGMAAWWLDDAPLLFSCRERAFKLFRDQDNALGAARMAIWLALDNHIFRRSPAIANGWLQRAQRLLESEDGPAFEHCFIAFARGHIALEGYDNASAIRFAGEARSLAADLRIIDFEMLSSALLGLALVSDGDVGEGMGLLDEAVTAAQSGELTDPDAIVTSCCYLFYACERVRDYQRASQWCDTLTELCRRWSYHSMTSVCRAHYAGILIWQGEWQEAERELLAANEELLAGRAGWAIEGLLRLAELRRLQGRTEEALELFDSAPEHPLSLVGRAEVAFDQADFLAARDLIERFLRRVRRNLVTERFNGLELAVRIGIQLGNEEMVHAALADMESAVFRIQTDPIRAAFARASGLQAVEAGDVARARPHLEDSVDLFLASRSPYEAARARLELARVLSMEGRHQIARAECRAALDTLGKLGARHQVILASRLMETISSTNDSDRVLPVRYPGLSKREAEILRLIAEGHTNPEIADELFISVRTVERHISSIYQKIGAEGSSARAMATAFALEHTPPGKSQIDS
jgi:LuxR family transcriptional regulator, maltose regulon positive regulatory protein